MQLHNNQQGTAKKGLNSHLQLIAEATGTDDDRCGVPKLENIP